MIATLGYLGILAALGSAGLLVVSGVRLARSDAPSISTLRLPVFGLVGGAAVAIVALEIGILTHDFSIVYVARNTATATPFVFLLAAGWAALEGSVVLWGVVLAGYTWLVWRKVGPGDGLGAGALAVMGGVAVFWFGLMATAANPFAVCTEVVSGVCSADSWFPAASAVAVADGVGPNPLLQNHILMAVHPPVLYLGYVGFTVPYAFAMSALARGDQGKVWLDRTHRWSLVAWSFLAAGIVLGGWWSYEVLGWGGYWAWDPVENAALLPWLAATAFVHSAVVQRRRGMLQAWNFVLVIATFTLTILGTFLTRSGVIASVHSFTQSAVGPLLLGFLAVVVVGSLVLFGTRAHLVASPPRLESLSSREGFLLLNNLLLTLFAFTVLFGTSYPLIVEAFTGREVSVGRPFFDRIAVPLAYLLLLTMGIGAIAPWRVATKEVLWARLRIGVNVGLVSGAVAVVAGVRSVPVVIVVSLAGFVVGTIVHFFGYQVRRARRGGKSAGQAMVDVLRGDSGYWGGQISHVGLAIVAVTIATTSALAFRGEVRLAEGEAVAVGGYCVRYEEPFFRSEPNRAVEGFRVTVLDQGCIEAHATLEPRLHAYPAVGQVIATPDVWTIWNQPWDHLRAVGRGAWSAALIDDIYLSIAGTTESGIALSVLVFPLQWLLWLGGAVVVGGGLFALTGRRRRRAETPDPDAERHEVSGV